MIYDEEPNFKVKMGYHHSSFGYSWDYENIVLMIIVIICLLILIF